MGPDEQEKMISIIKALIYVRITDCCLYYRDEQAGKSGYFNFWQKVTAEFPGQAGLLK